MGPGALVVAGLLLEVLWLIVGTLSAWITEVPAFTAALAPAQSIPWSSLYPLFQATLGADHSGIAPPPPALAARIGFVSALALCCAVYVVMLGILRKSTASTSTWIRIVIALSVLFEVTVLATPGLVSGDVILYATFGRLAGVQAIDPYLVSNSWSLVSGSDATWWWFVPTPYGPAWTDLSAILAAATAQASPLLQVLTFKVLAGLSLLADLALIWCLARRLDPAISEKDRLLALALFGWNPLVLFETGQGHNDLLIAALLLLALVPLAAKTPGLGNSRVPTRLAWFVTWFVLILDMLIKYLPAITGLYLFVVQLRQSPRTRTRVWTAIGVAASAVGLTLIAALPWRDSPAVFQTIVNATAGGQRYADSLVDIPTFPIVARFLDRLSEHIPESVAAVRFWQQVIVRTLFVIYVAWETARLWQTKLESHSQLLRGAIGAALRTTLIVVIFVLTQTLDYYFISPLALAAVLGWRSTWTRVGFAISVLYLPTFYARREDLEPVPNLFLIIALGLPMVIGLISSFSGHLHAFTVRRTADA